MHNQIVQNTQFKEDRRSLLNILQEDLRRKEESRKMGSKVQIQRVEWHTPLQRNRQKKIGILTVATLDT